MLALGACLLVSVAANSPATTTSVRPAEKVASTYDEAFCDPADGGECAQDAEAETISLPALPAILDCESPFIEGMIGSCDLPRPTMPSLHVPTVRNGGTAFGSGKGGRTTDQLSDGATPASTDAALPRSAPTLAPLTHSIRVAVSFDTATLDVHPSRLDRPPRA
jgi:hypothetical protein